jgi:hypothetical protein
MINIAARAPDGVNSGAKRNSGGDFESILKTDGKSAFAHPRKLSFISFSAVLITWFRRAIKLPTKFMSPATPGRLATLTDTTS